MFKDDRYKTKTIVRMAISFTSMLRVFKKDSVKTIEPMIEGFVQALNEVHTQVDFDARHKTFCQDFIKRIRLAKAKNGKRVSYGHAAKVLDVALKVCVYYCQLPDKETSQRVKGFLHAGIDTKILEELKKDECSDIKANTIQEISPEEYRRLQQRVEGLISTKKEFEGFCPVVWDNVMWWGLNKADRG